MLWRYLFGNDQPGISHKTIYRPTSLPTRWPLQSYTARRVAKSLADNAMHGRERCGTIPNQVRGDARPSIVGTSEQAFVTGRLTWLLVLDTLQALVTQS